MTDLISIIVPIYRVEAYLEQCIWSIRNQTYKYLEIILVDDGSDDQCPQICDNHAQDDKRIKVIHKENGGADSARKAGMLEATGKYVGYVDGDDWIETEMYEKLLTYMQEHEVEVVESGVIDSYKDKERKRVPYLKERCYKGEDFMKNVEPKLLFSGVFFEHGISPYLWSKLFLKERIIKYQMICDITNEIQDDTMVSLPCIAESRKLYVSHDCFYHYRVRNDSLKRECRKDEIINLLTSYKDFYERFRGTGLYSDEDKQIKYYVMYWLLYKAPYVFDGNCTNRYLIPFGGLKKADKIVLYGAGAAGIHLENYISKIEEINIVCWLDKNYKDLQKIGDIKNPKDIVDYEYDYVIITILRGTAVQNAKKDLLKLGVPEKKILWIEQRYINNPELLLNKVFFEEKGFKKFDRD
ncbi:MAG: glycosyltransferase family 2 protein [Lachnospiraceae bacterium]|nr:glycosyltransferase family 2 protein [Lachnospiraceae bacterium]